MEDTNVGTCRVIGTSHQSSRPAVADLRLSQFQTDAAEALLASKKMEHHEDVIAVFLRGS